MSLTIRPISRLSGSMRPPSDKSLTHRAYMFAAIASGPSLVKNPLRGEDCESTLRCLNWMGLRHEWLSPTEVRLIPTQNWEQPPVQLDCGNSGTTMRLLSGLIASRPLDVTMIGDASLSKRPMKRIAVPLREMGATVQGDTPPLRVKGTQLTAITYHSPVASAQIKSCTLLAGLRADGTTTVIEPTVSRDHTERMLTAIGIKLDREFGDQHKVSVKGGQIPTGFEFDVPGDISSAAFFMVAAALVKKSEVEFRDVSVNPSRTGILDVLHQCGVPVQVGQESTSLNEPVSSFVVKSTASLKPFTIQGDLVPRLIDEIPVLAVLATQCHGTSVIKDAKELRVKESDRVETVAVALRAMGAQVETFEDGMAITGPTHLSGATIESHGDHRIAMAFAIAGLIAKGETTLLGSEAIATSFPAFESELARLSNR